MNEPLIPREPIPPELVEFARQTFDEGKYLEELRQMREEGGGVPLDDFIAEVEARAL